MERMQRELSTVILLLLTINPLASGDPGILVVLEIVKEVFCMSQRSEILSLSCPVLQNVFPIGLCHGCV